MPDGDPGRWLTYQELADLLGCTPNAARMHAVRRKWPRRASNRIGEPAHVMVPENQLRRSRAMHGVMHGVMHGAANVGEPCDAPSSSNVRPASDAQEIRQAIEAATAPLVATITDLRQRLDASEEERRRLTALLAEQRSAPPAAPAVPEPVPARRSWWPWGRRA